MEKKKILGLIFIGIFVIYTILNLTIENWMNFFYSPHNFFSIIFIQIILIGSIILAPIGTILLLPRLLKPNTKLHLFGIERDAERILRGVIFIIAMLVYLSISAFLMIMRWGFNLNFL